MRQRGFSIAGLLKANNSLDAQGRLRQRIPVAIIDIGSNSVRQVIYEGLTRSPSVLFNEKILCGLGKGVAKDGRLDDDASQRALSAISRFARLGRQLGVGETHVLATAAIREASNGADFISRVEAITGDPIHVLSGRMEAEYAALGIRAGFYKPEGITGDLGGGSMELIEINGDVGNGVTTPLGSLRLQEMSRKNLDTARNIACKTLSNARVNWPGKARTFYAIGGTWRSLARLHMMEIGHPVEVVHGYAVNADEYADFCRQLASAQGPGSFKRIEEISGNRRPLLPYGAIVMAEVLEQLGAQEVVTSAVGLREGLLYSLLDKETQQQDALVEAAAELSLLRARSPLHCRELAQWTQQALEEIGIVENESQCRCRIAACYLADIAWRSTSDFRAEQTLGVINNSGINSISHEGRAFLSMVTYHRHQGLGGKKSLPGVARLVSGENIRLARILAALFRIAYLFSGAIEGILPSLAFQRDEEGQLFLHLPASLADMNGEKPQSRLEGLARELGEKVEISID